MTKLRKLRPTMWITLVVYLLIVGSGAALAGQCCYLDSGRGALDSDACHHTHEQGAVSAVNGHASELEHTATGASRCDCSLLPISTANSAVPTLGAAASSVWMHGAAYASCSIDSSLVSEIPSGGDHSPPLVSVYNPVLKALQTVFLLI